MFGKVFGDREGRHREDLFLMHQLHCLSAKLISVIDGGNAALCGEERARLAGGMNRNPLASARRLLHGDAEFGFCVLVGSRQLAFT
jgi:hypothetical protein